MNGSVKVLFIGNSHTYVNDMPYMFRYLAERARPETEFFVTMLALPGITLGYHAMLPSERFALMYGDYDYAVLQQQAHPFMGREALLREAGYLWKHAQGTKTVPVAAMTWAEKAFPEHQDEMADAYEALAQTLGAVLSPVGRAWAYVRAEHPEIELYYADGEHSSPAGAYLAACVHLKAILGISPIGLPGKIEKNGKAVAEIPEETARILQEAAQKA